MSKLRNGCFAVSAIVSSTFALPLLANTSVQPENISIPYTNEQITIDGELNEAVWQNAEIIELDLVNSPWNNTKSPVKTTAKLIENSEYLYIAFLADDPAPSAIKGVLADRDTTWADDMVGVKLDTFNSHLSNYQFFVNPFGVQNDRIANEVTGEVNDLWDAIWHSYGKKTANGYQVEIAIPYNVLNFEQSDQEKTWAIELIRLYPRNERLRISHMPIDRNNDCWACQMPEIKGFKEATIGKNFTLTPTLTGVSNQLKNVYQSQSDWQKDNDLEAGLDLRWGINSATLLNATINPDFSSVETDAGQLSVNKTFSLYYDEKRQFFLENANYFSSVQNLVYTRNIANPDYGLKLTGREDQHTYGIFATNDTETNFIVPGNLGSSLASLNAESHSAAINYRFDQSEKFSVGVISTFRTAEHYHNTVAGIDSRYRINETNTLTAQYLRSDAEYPTETNLQPYTLNAQTTTDRLNDDAYTIKFRHKSEYWQIDAERQKIGSEFRADLGFMPKANFIQNHLATTRQFYGDDDNLWQEIFLYGHVQNQQDEDGNFLAREFKAAFEISGAMLSYFNIQYTDATRVGLFKNISGNNDQFDEQSIEIYGSVSPTSYLELYTGTIFGDQIDYDNNRLGKRNDVYGGLTFHANEHLTVKVNAEHTTLDADHANVYKAFLADVRVAYQFDVQSYLKLNLVYQDVERNPDNNPAYPVTKRDKGLATQLIYSYKVNPKTVFFLGYSDNSFQDDYLSSLERDQRTFFTKISYAWQL